LRSMARRRTVESSSTRHSGLTIRHSTTPIIATRSCPLPSLRLQSLRSDVGLRRKPCGSLTRDGRHDDTAGMSSTSSERRIRQSKGSASLSATDTSETRQSRASSSIIERGAMRCTTKRNSCRVR
jgi:hypothetical protein